MNPAAAQTVLCVHRHARATHTHAYTHVQIRMQTYKQAERTANRIPFPGWSSRAEAPAARLNANITAGALRKRGGWRWGGRGEGNIHVRKDIEFWNSATGHFHTELTLKSKLQNVLLAFAAALYLATFRERITSR